MIKQLQQKIASFFFGNYFYGTCAVALSIEASLQQHSPLNPWYYYLLVFTLCTWFYTTAYKHESSRPNQNPRSVWYVRNKTFVRYSQAVLLLITGIIFLFITFRRTNQLVSENIFDLICIALFPCIAFLYYHKYNLRNIGWLKPFTIGFIWAGMCTIYPVYFAQLKAKLPLQLSYSTGLLFVKNFMFVTVLCIMFDIKDYAMDYNQELKTFVVKTGLRKTIFYIIIPLLLAGLGSFLLYGWYMHFSYMRILLNTIPFLCSIALAYSLHRRKSILYYLVLIDGMMLVKAICGSLAVVYF